VVQLDWLQSNDTFQPGLASDHWRCAIHNSHFGQSNHPSGRTNIYEQAQAGYTNLEIINLDQSNVAIQINDSITIELQDSTATFVPIFGGSVVEVGIAVAEVGGVDYTQRINIIALGALARLPKALTEGVLNDDFDGDQIYTILKEVLFLSHGKRYQVH
jgi:hypothetical protein